MYERSASVRKHVMVVYMKHSWHGSVFITMMMVATIGGGLRFLNEKNQKDQLISREKRVGVVRPKR